MDLAGGIRAALNGRRQIDVANRLGVAQNTVSRWATGTNLPKTLDQLSAIEEACDRPAGFILNAAGYIQVTSVPEAIAMDPGLTDHDRDFLLAGYRHAIETSRKDRPGDAEGRT